MAHLPKLLYDFSSTSQGLVQAIFYPLMPVVAAESHDRAIGRVPGVCHRSKSV